MWQLWWVPVQRRSSSPPSCMRCAKRAVRTRWCSPPGSTSRWRTRRCRCLAWFRIETWGLRGPRTVQPTSWRRAWRNWAQRSVSASLIGCWCRAIPPRPWRAPWPVWPTTCRLPISRQGFVRATSTTRSPRSITERQSPQLPGCTLLPHLRHRRTCSMRVSPSATRRWWATP